MPAGQAKIVPSILAQMIALDMVCAKISLVIAILVLREKIAVLTPAQMSARTTEHVSMELAIARVCIAVLIAPCFLARTTAHIPASASMELATVTQDMMVTIARPKSAQMIAADTEFVPMKTQLASAILDGMGMTAH